MLRFGVLVLTLLVFVSQPIQVFAQSGYSVSDVSVRSSKKSNKKAKRAAQKKKANQKVQAAIKKVAQLLKKVPEDQKETVQLILASLRSAKKSTKRAKTSINQITKQANSVRKRVTTILKAIKRDGVENVDLVSELVALEEAAESVANAAESSKSGNKKSGSGLVNIRELPLVEEIFTTETFPSDVARLPNVEGIGDAFSAQELFFQSESNFTTLAGALEQQPSTSDCGSFASSDQDGSIGGYEACRSVSAFTGPITDLATASFDLCVAMTAVTAETLGRGVTRNSGSGKTSTLYSNNGVTQLNLSDGRTIYVQIGETNSIEGRTSLWSCASGESTSDRITHLNLSTSGGRATVTGTFGSNLISADLRFLLSVDEDGDLTPTGDVTSRILKVSGDYYYDNYLKFRRDGNSDAYSEIINVTGGTSTFFETRSVPGQFYLTGYDRLRVNGVYPTSTYTKTQNAVTQGYRFGTLSYITDSTQSALASSFDSTDEVYTTAANGSTIELDASTVSTAQVTCAPTGGVSASFTVNLAAEKVQDAIAACTETPTVGDACSADSAIVAAGVNFNGNCS